MPSQRHLILNIVFNKFSELNGKLEFKLMKEKCYVRLLEEKTLQLRLNEEYLTVKNTSEIRRFVLELIEDFFDSQTDTDIPSNLDKEQINFAKYLVFTYVFSSSLEVMAILLKNGMSHTEDSMDEFKQKMREKKTIDVETFKL